MVAFGADLGERVGAGRSAFIGARRRSPRVEQAVVARSLDDALGARVASLGVDDVIRTAPQRTLLPSPLGPAHADGKRARDALFRLP
jgi:hypothetical protein